MIHTYRYDISGSMVQMQEEFEVGVGADSGVVRLGRVFDGL